MEAAPSCCDGPMLGDGGAVMGPVAPVTPMPSPMLAPQPGMPQLAPTPRIMPIPAQPYPSGP